MRNTLHNSWLLLRHGGMLIVNELLCTDSFYQITFGMTDGWWLFSEVQDPERIGQQCPLLSRRQWEGLLASSGFRHSHCVRGDSFMRNQAVIVGQASVQGGQDHTDVNALTVANGTHLVTNGYGRLGLMTARALLSHGAKNVLFGHGATHGRLSADDQAEWTSLTSAGCVRHVDCNVAVAEEMRSVLGPLGEHKDRILRTIFHDGTLTNLGEKMMVAKLHAENLSRAWSSATVGGVKTLHGLTHGVPLGFFSSFISLATQLEASEHAPAPNAAAEAWLMAIADYRCSLGLRGQNVAWAATQSSVQGPRSLGILSRAALGAALTRVLLPSVDGFAVLPPEWVDVLSAREVRGVLTPYAHLRGRPRVTKDALPAERAATGSALGLLAVLELVSQTAGSAVDADAPLMESGVDSLGAVELRNQLQGAAGIALPATLMFEHPTARQIATFLQPISGASDEAASGLCHRSAFGAPQTAVGVGGLSVQSPGGAASIRAIRRMMQAAFDACTDVPPSRWDLTSLPPQSEVVASRVRYGNFVQSAELFDHVAFGIAPTETEAMDPQQRLLLERGYEALHKDGCARQHLTGSVTGVFLGIAAIEFQQLIMASPAGSSVYACSGASLSIAAGRLSYVLGLNGSCMSIDTACSAGLVAFHGGLRAQQLDECVRSVVTAVNLFITPVFGICWALAGFTSPGGRCHTFDARADGYSRGEGCGAVTLRSDGEHAVSLKALGSAVRQDGRSASLTAPSGQAQHGMLVTALATSGISATDLGRVDAHGTGTALGDPIEMGSLASAVVKDRPQSFEQPLAVGGVKANIGHAEPAAGFTGLVKLVVEMRARQAVPNAQLRVLNTLVEHASSGGVFLPVEAAAAPDTIGGVNSFGYSGTIAHAVLQRVQEQTARLSQSQLRYRRRVFSWSVMAKYKLHVGGAPAKRAPSTAGPIGLAAVLNIVHQTAGSSVDADSSLLEDSGIDSLGAVELRDELQRTAGESASLPSRLLFDHPTARELTAFIEQLQANASGGIDEAPPRHEVDTSFGIPLSAGLQASSCQLSFVLLHKMLPSVASYAFPFALELPHGFEPSLVRSALNLIINRHAILRTYYDVGVDGAVLQTILPPNSFVVPLAECSEANWRQSAESELATPFALTTAPPVRALLMRAMSGSSTRMRLMVNIHHVATDYVANMMLRRELRTACTAFHSQTVPALPPVEVALQYADACLWQQRQTAAGDDSAAMEWWLNELRGAPSVLALPLDRPRGSVQDAPGRVVDVGLRAASVQQLRVMCKQLSATASHGMMAAWAALLMRRSEEEDVVLGVPASVREHAELASISGCFVNTLALRLSVGPNQSFLDLVRHVSARMREILLRSLVPFFSIVQKLKPTRVPGANPIFQTVLQVLPRLKGVDASERMFDLLQGVQMGSAVIDLWMNLEEMADESIAGIITYDSAIFRENSIRRLMREYTGLMTSAIDSPDFWIGTLSMPDPRPQLAAGLRVRQMPCIQRGADVVIVYEVEDALRGHVAIADVVVFPAADYTLGETVGAAILLATGQSRPTLDELRAFGRAALKPNWLPEVVVFVASSALLKLKRTELSMRLGLPERETDGPDTWEVVALDQPPRALVSKQAKPKARPSPSGAKSTAPAMSPSAKAETLTKVVASVAKVIRKPPSTVDPLLSLMDVGIDSMSATLLVSELEAQMEVSLPPTLIFTYSTADAIAAHLIALSGGLGASESVEQALAFTSEGSIVPSIVSAGCRWAGGANSLVSLGALADATTNVVTQIPASRWAPASDVVHRFPAARHGGFMPHVQLFDSALFNVSHNEAAWMDPQQRLVLEYGYDVLHTGGHERQSLLGANIALVLGIQAMDFTFIVTETPVLQLPVYAATGQFFSPAAGRLSFVLGLQGACFPTDTACSTALVATHLAAGMLRDAQCDGAISVGVNIMLYPMVHVLTANSGMTSRDGRCKFLDNRANGYVRSEGVGTLLLEPEDDADATTRMGMDVPGSSVRSDGKSASLTAPNGEAQVRLLAVVISRGGIAADDVHVTECHGTGTALGDPIEATSLRQVLMPLGREGVLHLGGIKANLGHMEPGAGQVGLFKLCSTLKVAKAAPNAQLRVLNPMVGGALRDASYALPTQHVSYADTISQRNSAGGVSSFGYAGTIAHVALQAAVHSVVPHVMTISQAVVRKWRAFPWRAVVHPLVQTRLAATPKGDTFRSPASGLWQRMVEHHYVAGRIVAPAASQVETAHGAFTALAGKPGGGVCVTRQTLIAPLIIGENDDLHVEISVASATGKFEVSTGVGVHSPSSWTTHSIGTGRPGVSSPWMASDLAKARATLHFQFDTRGLYAKNLAGNGVQLHPEYQIMGRTWLEKGGGHAISQLSVTATPMGCHIHPAIVDSLLQLTMTSSEDPGTTDTWLPFSIGEAQLRRLDGGKRGLFTCTAPRPGGMGTTGDSVIRYARRAQPDAQMVSLRLQVFKAPAAGSATKESNEYHITWSAAKDACDTVADLWTWLFIGATRSVASSAKRAHPPSGTATIVLAYGAANEGSAAEASVCMEATVLAAVLRGRSGSLLVLTANSKPSPISVIPGGHHGGSHLGLWGLARSVRLEAPSMHLACIGVGGAGSCASARALPALSQLEGVTFEQVCHIPRLDRLSPQLSQAETSGTSDASSPSTHVITGGTGGIGFIFARWLLSRPNSAVVLTSRSGRLSAAATAALHAVTNEGCEHSVRTCDSAHPSDVHRIFAFDVQPSRPLGLWHLAGQLADKMLGNVDGELLRAAWGAKANGAEWLQRAASWARISAFVLFSSVTAVVGNVGQGVYGASNARLDGLATWRRHRAQPASSVQWGPWAGGGMAAATLSEKALSQQGVRAVSEALGIAAVQMALMPKAPAVMTMFIVEWSKFVARRPEAALLSALTPGPRPKKAVVATPSAPAAKTSLSLGPDAVLEIVKKASGEAADVGVDTPLMDAGLDSLAMTDVRNQLQDAIGDGVDLPATLLFDAPTARELSSLIDESTAVACPQAPAVAVRAPAACAMSVEAVLAVVKQASGDSATVEADTPLMDAGLDSLAMTDVRNQLQDAIGEAMDLPATLLFDAPTARELAGLINENAGPELDGVMQLLPEGSPIGAARSSLSVLGSSAHLPGGAGSLHAFGQVVASKRTQVDHVPISRWDFQAMQARVPQMDISSAQYDAWIHNAHLFDPLFFGISPAEARSMDPQQRILLERGYEALHEAGHSKSTLLHKNVGAMVAIGQLDWTPIFNSSPARHTVYAATSAALSVAAGRLSYSVGLRGPNTQIDTACSATLVSLHFGMRCIQNAECESCLVATANIHLDGAIFMAFAIAGMLSRTAACHTWDRGGDGFARGEMCGGILIGPRPAVYDGACPLHRGEFIGTGLRQDGKSASLTAPSGPGQKELLAAAWMDAGVDPGRCGVYESHGTGTALGDPIEIGTVKGVLRKGDQSTAASLRVSGIKANLGHTEEAAGMPGLLILCMALDEGATAPNARLRMLNPALAPALKNIRCDLPIQLAEQLGEPFGGVSSLSYNGTIAHAVMRADMSLDRHKMLGQRHAPTFKRRAFRWEEAGKHAAADGQTARAVRILSMQERADASYKAQQALDTTLASNTNLPANAEVTIVGAGLAGLLLAGTFADAKPLAVLEKSATAGGVWRHYGNAFSRVNSSEPSYRLLAPKAAPNTNHSYHSEILGDALRTISDNRLARRIHTATEVHSASMKQGSWVLAGQRRQGAPTAFELPSAFVVLATNRRLGRARSMHLADEATFGGPVYRGLSGDVNTMKCSDERIVVLGMGAFAIENMRTSFERSAAHVTILCRRRGTVCPQIVDWVNFIRPFDIEGKHDRAGDAVVLSHWHSAYNLSGATRPECWREGILKPDGHTVSTSDMFFIGCHLQMAATRLGEVARLEPKAVITRDGQQLDAGVLIKCVGFELNEGNERLLGRARMRINSQVAHHLWMLIEPHLDSRAFNNPFGSSYLHFASFMAKIMRRHLRDAALARTVSEATLPLVRLNHVTASDALHGINVKNSVESDDGNPNTVDPEVPRMLQEHLASVAEGFNQAMPPKEYIDTNRQLWDAVREMLLQRAPSAATALEKLAYPFAQLFDELPDLSRERVQTKRAVARGGPVMTLAQVIEASAEVIGGTGLDADTPLTDAGLDSMGATELRSSLQVAAGVDLPATLVFDAPTARLIAQMLSAVPHDEPEDTVSDLPVSSRSPTVVASSELSSLLSKAAAQVALPQDAEDAEDPPFHLALLAVRFGEAVGAQPSLQPLELLLETWTSLHDQHLMQAPQAVVESAATAPPTAESSPASKKIINSSGETVGHLDTSQVASGEKKGSWFMRTFAKPGSKGKAKDAASSKVRLEAEEEPTDVATRPEQSPPAPQHKRASTSTRRAPAPTASPQDWLLLVKACAMEVVRQDPAGERIASIVERHSNAHFADAWWSAEPSKALLQSLVATLSSSSSAEPPTSRFLDRLSLATPSSRAPFSAAAASHPQTPAILQAIQTDPKAGLQALRGLASVAVNDTALLAALMLQLAKHVLDDQLELDAVIDHFILLVNLTLAPSGAEVQLKSAASTMHEVPPVAVLVCGFGGSSLEALDAVCGAYTDTWPSWRVVATTRVVVDDEDAQAAQTNAVMKAIDGCPRIVVHVLSNHGHSMWIELLKRHGDALQSRLAALIFDCAPASVNHVEPLHMVNAAVYTIRMGLTVHGLAGIVGQGRKRLEAISECLLNKGVIMWLDEHTLEWQTANEPVVPTLCLTSDTDTVIPRQGVEAFAALLREASPSREVRVQVCRGSHARLLDTDGANVLGALVALVEVAGLPLEEGRHGRTYSAQI